MISAADRKDEGLLDRDRTVTMAEAPSAAPSVDPELEAAARGDAVQPVGRGAGAA